MNLKQTLIFVGTSPNESFGADFLFFYSFFFQTLKMIKIESVAGELREAITTLEDGCRVYGEGVSFLF